VEQAQGFYWTAKLLLMVETWGAGVGARYNPIDGSMGWWCRVQGSTLLMIERGRMCYAGVRQSSCFVDVMDAGGVHGSGRLGLCWSASWP
jgi:hypothetical protein